MLGNILHEDAKPCSLIFLLIFILVPLVSCQENSVFGMSPAAFEKMLAENDYDAFLALPSGDIERSGSRGPSVFYYCARWLEGASKLNNISAEKQTALEERRIALYRLAFERTSGIMRRESGHALTAALSAKAAALPERLAEQAAARTAAQNAAPAETGTAQTAAQTGGSVEAAAKTRDAAADADALAAAWNEVLKAAGDVGDALGPDYAIRRARLDALEALGRDEELFRELGSLKTDFPEEAEADRNALAFFELKSRHNLKKKGWADLLKDILLVEPVGDWTEKALDFALSLDTDNEGISSDLLYAGRMRVAVRGREYGRAFSAATKALKLVLAPTASKNLVADAGKAFLYSGSSELGVELFKNAFGSAGEIGALRKASARETAWTAAYYRARFLRTLKRWDEAAKLFESIASAAPTQDDCDAALYYLADSRISDYDEKAAAEAALADRRKKPGTKAPADRESAARRARLAILEAVSSQWKDPAQFADTADTLLRSAVAARDWDFIRDFAQSLAPSLDTTLHARALYLCGRAFELGWTVPVPESVPGQAAPVTAPSPVLDSAAACYRALLSIDEAPLYYRVLAARRLNQELPLIPEDKGPPSDLAQNELCSFYMNYVKDGFACLVYRDAKPRLDKLDAESVRSLAGALSRAERYPDSIRLMLALKDRPGWEPRRSDYELLYPRAYLSAIRGSGAKVPEHLLYALLRSESLFQTDVVSSAGAIGLSQLMPGTAAETARGLGLANYDLTKPADNVRIGASHFAELLDETGQHPLRAMWAYNAGRGRLRTWLSGADGLPDDLLLESLSIAETRQYGRNILQAAVMYGELYSGMKAAGIVDEIMGESGALF